MWQTLRHGTCDTAGNGSLLDLSCDPHPLFGERVLHMHKLKQHLSPSHLRRNLGTKTTQNTAKEDTQQPWINDENVDKRRKKSPNTNNQFAERGTNNAMAGVPSGFVRSVICPRSEYWLGSTSKHNTSHHPVEAMELPFTGAFYFG